MQIYIENLIITNALVYFIFLFLIKTFFKFETSKLRILFASFVGGLTSIILSMPHITKFDAWFFELILVLFLLSFCYKNMNLKKLIVSTISLIILSNLFYSILNGITKFHIKNNTILYSQLPLFVSLFIISIVTFFIKLFLDILLSKLKLSSNLIEIELEYNNKKINTIGLVDTGNNLCFKNSPVSFINFDIFSQLTGIGLDNFLAKKYDKNDYDFVEVNSLAGNKKMLLLKLNKIKVKINNNYKIINSPQVAVSLKILKKDYKMILNHNIL